MSLCPKCQREFEPGAKFCASCGVPLVPKDKTIPRCVLCETPYPEGTKFCPKDGGEVIAEAFRKEGGSPLDIGRKLEPTELESLISREHTVRIGDWLRRGWGLFRENPGAFIGFNALLAVGTGVLSHVPIAGALLCLAMAPLWAGFYIVAFKMLKKRKTEFVDFFKGYAFFLPLFLAALVTGIFVAAGTLLLIVPGVYLAVGYLFTFLLIVDRRMDFWQAMEASRKVVTRNWFSFFNLLLLLLLINIGGAILLLVGLLVTVPVSFCTIAAAYEDVFGVES